MMWQSRKARDLLRDDRILVTTGWSVERQDCALATEGGYVPAPPLAGPRCVQPEADTRTLIP
jgi:hypothetical protein